MKKGIIAALIFSGCSTTNKIAVQYSKYGGLHYMKYTTVEGKLYVRGSEVKLIPGTYIYAGKVGF